MECRGCKKTVYHTDKEQLNPDGYCSKCVSSMSEQTKVKNDLLTAFGGTGRRGLVQWLKIGKFLHNISTDEEIHCFNDRMNIIREIIGGADKYEKLIDKFVDIVLEISKES